MSKRILLGLGILLFAGLCLAQVFVLQRRPSAVAAGFTKLGDLMFTNAAGSITNDFTLPGGPLQEGDLVIVALASDATFSDDGIMTSGYTNIFFINLANNPGHQLSCKIMGPSPDTTVGIKTEDTDVTAGIIQSWRGANSTIYMDVTALTNKHNTGMPDSLAITPSTVGSLIFTVGFLDDDDVSNVSAPSGYSSLVFTNTGLGSSTIGASVMMASKIWSSGEEDPGIFGGSGDDAGYGVTFAIRPK